MDEDKEPKPKKQPVKRAVGVTWHMIKVLIGATSAALIFALLIFIVSLRGREVDLPSWAIDPLKAELSNVQGDVSVDFENAFLFVTDDWQPKIVLTGVALKKPDEPSFLRLGRVDAGFSLADALRGALVPTDINVEGVFINLIRDLDGKIKVKFGEIETTDSAFPSLQDVAAGIDEALISEALSKFKSLQILAITLNFQDMRAERSWTVDGARIVATRSGNTFSIRSDLALLSGGADVATIETNFASVIGQSAAKIGITLTDIQSTEIATQSAALAWLGVINAPISGALRLDVLRDGTLGPLNGTLQIGAGALQPTQGVKPILFDGARTYFSFDPAVSTLKFSEIALQSQDVTLVAEGYAQLTYDGNWPKGMVSQLAVSNLILSPDGFENPVNLSQAVMDFDLQFDPFQVRIGELFIRDAKRDVSVLGRGLLRADETGWTVALDATSQKASFETVQYFWQPVFFDKIKQWVDTNIRTGELRDISFSLRSDQGQQPITDLSFAFDQASAKVVKFLPEIQDASGVFSLSNDVLVTQVTSGRMRAAQGGWVNFGPTNFVIQNVRQKPAQAYVDLTGSGTITAIVDLLNADPLSVMDRIKQPVTLADGRGFFQSRIDFPIKKGAKPNEIFYTATAQLRDVKTTKLVKDRTLVAPQLDLVVNNTALEISGSGRFDGIPFQGRFTSGIGTSPDRANPKVTASFNIASNVIDAFSVPLPAGLFSGSAPARFALEFPKGASPVFSVESNLVGAQLKIDGLGWTKPRTAKGKLDLEGTLGQNFAITKLDIQGGGANLISKVRFSSDRKFQSLDFAQFTLGKGINVSGEVLPNGKLRILGGRVDLASFLARQQQRPSQQDPNRGGLSQVDIVLDQLVLSENQDLRNFKGSFSMGKGPDGTFNGLINGAAKINGRVTPTKQGIDLIVTSKDAGKVLTALGALNKANGGDLVLTLGATSTPGVRDGILHVTGVKVQNAPVLAELLNVISVVGLLEQMSGPGILMSEIDAKFRLTPNQLIVSSSSAVGPSIGLSADGYYNLGDKSLDFQGVVSPLYLFNGVGQIFTRKGEGLIGFNFNLKGNTTKPKFSVNPFSILTPVMFREIFRRPAPKLD